MNIKEKTALKNMRFNRFILLRYALALFFFTNLNWLIFMIPGKSMAMGIPAIMLLFALIPTKNFIRLYSDGEHTKNSKLKPYYLVQLVLNGLLILGSFNNSIFSALFPFFNTNIYGKSGALILLSLGAIIAFVCVRKVTSIELNEDSGYKYFSNFKKTLKVSEIHGK